MDPTNPTQADGAHGASDAADLPPRMAEAFESFAASLDHPRLEALAQRLDADGPMRDRALEIVRAFIVRHRLVVFGGLAIDYALRLRGGNIYSEDERPDYDFLSPDSVTHAYQIADELAEAGFENIAVIRAIHLQTMKVRVDAIYVADLGYAPPDVFESLPYLEYQGGLRIIHPDYQRMDQHLAFCFPYSNAPREDIFHRWRKDLKRWNLVDRYYPIASAAVSPELAAVTVETGCDVAGEDAAALDVALHGFAAYAVLCESLELLRAAASAADGSSAPPYPPLVFHGRRGFTVQVPAVLTGGDRVHLVSPDPEKVLTAPGRRHYPYMDVMPSTLVGDAVTVISSSSLLFAASVCAAPGGTENDTRAATKAATRAVTKTATKAATKAATKIAAKKGGDSSTIDVHRTEDVDTAATNVGGSDGSDADGSDAPPGLVVRVVSPQALLLLFLYGAHRGQGAVRDCYLHYYTETLRVLREAEEIFVELARQYEREEVMQLFLDSPFAPTVKTIGRDNHSAAYTVRMASNATTLHDVPPAGLHLPPNITGLLKGLPQTYRPTKPHPPFDYAACAAYRRSGQPME